MSDKKVNQYKIGIYVIVFFGLNVLISILSSIGVSYLATWQILDFDNLKLLESCLKLMFKFLLFLGLIYTLRIYHGIKWCSFSKGFKIKRVLVTFSLFLLFLLFQEIFFYIKISFLERKNYQFDLSFKEYLSTSQIFNFISVVMITPLVEEVFFRRFILVNFLEKNKPIVAIIFTSLLFSISHMPYIETIIITFVLSVFLCYLYVKYDNLLYPILFHFLVNFIAFIFV